MHTITNNILLGFIEITVIGFWTPEEFTVFAGDLAAAIAAFPSTRPPMSLYNYTDAAIQPQVVVTQMQAMARNVAVDRSIAMYTDGCLARQQAKRVAAECEHMHVFDSRAEALDWLAKMRRKTFVQRVDAKSHG